MKHVIFTFSFLLFTMVGLAQSQSKTSKKIERAHHITSKSNKAKAIYPIHVNDDNASIDIRKCKEMGTYYMTNKSACDALISRPQSKPTSKPYLRIGTKVNNFIEDEKRNSFN